MVSGDMYVECNDNDKSVMWTENIFKEKVDIMKEAIDLHEDYLAPSLNNPNPDLKP